MYFFLHPAMAFLSTNSAGSWEGLYNSIPAFNFLLFLRYRAKWTGFSAVQSWHVDDGARFRTKLLLSRYLPILSFLLNFTTGAWLQLGTYQQPPHSGGIENWAL